MSAFGIGCTAICFVSVVARLTTSAALNFPVIVINLHKHMSTKAPECWASDANARAIKIELSAEQSLLLPLDQFAFAELESNGKEQTLRLVFATHEVSLRGHSLRRIETAMQRMELSYLAALPSNQVSLVPDGQPVVIEIGAAEVETHEKPSLSGQQ